MGGSETELHKSEVAYWAGRWETMNWLHFERGGASLQSKKSGVSRASHVKLPRFDGQNDLLGYLEQMVWVFTDEGTILVGSIG